MLGFIGLYRDSAKEMEATLMGYMRIQEGSGFACKSY